MCVLTGVEVRCGVDVEVVLKISGWIVRYITNTCSSSVILIHQQVVRWQVTGDALLKRKVCRSAQINVN